MHDFRFKGDQPVNLTKVVNNTGGNVILASQLFGNTPNVALKHYFTKADEEQARRALES